MMQRGKPSRGLPFRASVESWAYLPAVLLVIYTLGRIFL